MGVDIDNISAMHLNAPRNFLVFLAFLAVTHARCPTGAVQGTAPDDCYTLVSAPSGWYDAEETCVERGGHLASITDGFVNAFVRQQARERKWDVDYWVGGSNDQGNWTWSDGVPFKYQAWAKGQPSNDDSLCLSVKSATGQWYATSCFASKPFVCRLPAVAEQHCPTTVPGGSCPHCRCGGTTHPSVPQTTRRPVPTCRPTWAYINVTNKCYQVVDLHGSGKWGQEICDTVSANAVSIHSAEENQIVLNAALAVTGSRRLGVTIGLSFNSTTMAWADGSPVNYMQFAKNGKFMYCTGNTCMTAMQLREPEPGTEAGEWLGYDVDDSWATICVKPPTMQ